MRVAARLRDRLGFGVDVREVLENPTVARLAAALERLEELATDRREVGTL
jgi:hypothetical protein